MTDASSPATVRPTTRTLEEVTVGDALPELVSP